MCQVRSILKKIDGLISEGRGVRSSCRSVAKEFDVSPGEVEVLMAGRDNRYYTILGFDRIRRKI